MNADALPHECPPLLSFAEEREAARKRRDARLADALKRCRIPESYVEFTENFRCGKYDPRRSWEEGD
jgi:hypothetical protein